MWESQGWRGEQTEASRPADLGRLLPGCVVKVIVLSMLQKPSFE